VIFAAQSLSGESNRLELKVGKFLNSVRAACKGRLRLQFRQQRAAA